MPDNIITGAVADRLHLRESITTSKNGSVALITDHYLRLSLVFSRLVPHLLIAHDATAHP